MINKEDKINCNYVPHPLDSFNNYFRGYAEMLPQAVNKSEMDKIMRTACENCKHHNTTRCYGDKCNLYHNYMAWKAVTGDGPRIVTVIKEVPVRKVRKRREISDANQCISSVKRQISMYQKHYNNNNKELAFIYELVNKSNFKRARIHAARGGFDKIVDTIDKFINGELGTTKTENK